MFPVVAQVASDDPLTWVYLALAAVFGLIFIGLVVYLMRTARATDQHPEATSIRPTPADEDEEDADDDLEGEDIEAGSPTHPPEDDTTPDDTPAPGDAPTHSIRQQLAEGADASSFLARFVENTDGETLGETVGIDDDQIILKGDDGFLALSTEEVLQKDGDLVADPNIDWDRAEEAGEAWRQAQEDAMQYDDEGLPIDD